MSTPNPEWCNRCLVVVDSRTAFRAMIAPDKEFEYMDGAAGNPRKIINWAESMMIKSAGMAVFDNGPNRFVLEAITTWFGDPVCEVHLYELRAEELRNNTWRKK